MLRRHHQAHDDSDRLSDTQLITMVLTLMIAGHETTAHLIASGVAALLSHPDQLALLHDYPALIKKLTMLLTETEREPVVQPHTVTNDLYRIPEGIVNLLNFGLSMDTWNLG